MKKDMDCSARHKLRELKFRNKLRLKREKEGRKEKETSLLKSNAAISGN